MTTHAVAVARDEAGSVYIQCSEFCGNRISEPGRAGHAEGCGASDADIATLDAQLAAARIRAAADEEPEEEPSIECGFCKAEIKVPGEHDHLAGCDADSHERKRIDERLRGLGVGATASNYACPEPACELEFETDGGLLAHMEESGHVDPEAEPEEESDIEVDGGPAKRKRSAAQMEAQQAKIAYAHLWVDPTIESFFIRKMQERVDAGELDFGLPAGKACIGKQTVTPEGEPALEISCPHRPILRTVKAEKCDMNHKHTETLAQACLYHALAAFGGDQMMADLGPLFAGV